MLLQLADVQVSYDTKQVVHGVSLGIEEGETVALVGHNGAGKSTLLKAIFGMIPPRGGCISFNGQDITQASPAHHLELGIAYSPQGAEVFPAMPVADNLRLGGYTLKDSRSVNESMERIYEMFPVLFERRNAKAGVLSGGERQMLAMGIALMRSPKLYLLDEPSGGLAPKYVEKVFVTIQRIAAEFSTALLLVEQNLLEALEVSHRVFVMANGVLVFQGTPADIGSVEQLGRIFAGR